MRQKVVLFGHNSANQLDRMHRLLGPDWMVEAVPEDASQTTIDRSLEGTIAMVSRSFDRRHRAGSDLRLLQTTGTGCELVDLDLVPQGCTVCNVHGHEIGIAEYVTLAILEWTIGLRKLDASFRAGEWRGGAYVPGHFHDEVFGKTLGILGYGRIGREVARRAHALGMRVGAISRMQKRSEWLHWYVPLKELDRTLPDLDFLVVACALTPETTGLLDARRLGLLRSDAVLINVARARIVDEDALFVALRDGRLGGAILDVWYDYPTPTDQSFRPSRHPFVELRNVIVSPHASGWTSPLLDRRWGVIADNVRNAKAPERLHNIVRGRN
jgi:phosphoglycerate dehydrogenase-like enzyme